MRSARSDLDAAVEAIRQVPGYENFLRPPTFADVQAALTPMADTGGLVYLATTPTGSVALIVHAKGVEKVWLEFTDADLNALLVKYEGDQVTGGYLPGQLGAREWLEEGLAEALPLLGKRVIAPVAVRLHELGLKQVFLIPTGRLGLMPLHAACYPVNGEKVYFLDEFTVAYAPNARALVTAQREARRRSRELRLVGVGNPLPHPQPLHAARAELEEIVTSFPENACWPLYAEEATRAALLARIPEGTYLHFACHGLFDPETPLASRLELSGQESLTLRDILYGEARSIRARLAVLSTCQSALSDFQHLPDEFIGLPAGFLQTGVPGVVGTLWPVNDLSTALVMIKFYEFHLRGEAQTGQGPMPPAAALCRAQGWLREVTSGELAEYFARHQQLNEARHRMLARLPEQAVTAGLARFALDDPEARPFADSPYHWAPFVFVGV
jgi:CHAT domain-containing protein